MVKIFLNVLNSIFSNKKEIMVKKKGTKLMEGLEGLSPREKEILICRCKLQTDDEIASTLHISKKTVSTHLANINIKLGIAELNKVEIGFIYINYARQFFNVTNVPIVNDFDEDSPLYQQAIEELLVPENKAIEIDPDQTQKSKEFIKWEKEYLNPTNPVNSLEENNPDPIALQIKHTKNIEVELPNKQLVLIPTNFNKFKEKVETDQEFYSLVVAETNMTLTPRGNRTPDFSRNRFYLFLFIGVGFAFVGAYAFLSLFTNNRANPISPIGIPQTVIVENIKEVTVEVPVTALAAAQFGPTQTALVEQIVVTATPPPPTPTDVPVPVLETGFIFSDNFDLGPDPAWDVIYGDPGMANGKYTVIAPFKEAHSKNFSLLSEKIWENAKIEVEISGFEGGQSSGGKGAIILRYLREKGGVGLIIYPGQNGIQFGILSPNGEWTLIDSSLVDGGWDDFNFKFNSNIVRVEVIGETFFAYINDTLITSTTISGFDHGQIGLWMLTNNIISSPEYYAPRFEYITIESLP
jgi:hypothetical protein